ISTWSYRSSLVVVVALSLCHAQSVIAETKMKFGGAGWLGYGSIVSTQYKAGDNDIEGKTLISSGAQVVLAAEVNERVDIQAGVGAGGGHTLAGTFSNFGGYAPFSVGPYIAQANFTLHGKKEEDGALFLRGGLFAYDYAKENQNLGLYLLRGPVYPGFVLSGFETKHVLPVANFLGLQVHHRISGFRQDFLIQVETEFYPYYDISPAYVASYQPGSAFRIGAGVNFHHYIPVDPSLTTDTLTSRWVDTLTTPYDTVQLSAKGVKVMANAMVDLKALFGGMDALGPEDLKIYGEAALFGIRNEKVDKRLYGGYGNRMPKMIGINLPTFKLLDRLAFEVEHYSAPFADNLELFNHAGKKPTPIPLDPDTSITKDDFKWSLYGSKVFQNHIKVSLQVASDHFRPGVFTGYGDNNPARSEAVLFRPQDWYWMSKVAYFF
ncbi:MAG TPA: hypothetical protein VK465_06435, partial [Fibrobacteria bacterium]|nr:hypothetical protein [Fibrobacteria bacterium]